MSFQSQHPDYGQMTDDYRQMRDTYAGQRTVKAAGGLYLPATGSQLMDGAGRGMEPGASAYAAYLSRAIFPGHVEDALRTFVGILNKEAYEISVPSRMEGIFENATRANETLDQLLRKIHEAQLLYGRCGLLLDVAEGSDLPHIVSYDAQSITNWDTQRWSEQGRDILNLVVTTEDSYVRGAEGAATYDWALQTLFRGMYLNDSGKYATAIEQEGQISPEVVPSFAGRTLDFVPFTFIGANDLSANPGSIPLLNLSNSALSIYRGEADFRQTLHMLGQDTLVMIGEDSGSDLEDEPTRIGTGAKISLPEGSDAKFIGISSEGLPEQRRTLEDDYARAIAMGSRLLENTSSQAESGEALRVRVAAKTTTLHSIALTSATGLENCLKQMATWVGANPEEVRVSPNLDFIEDAAAPEQALKMIEARNAGMPISLHSIHEWASKNEFTQKTWDEELDLMKEEASVLSIINGGAPVDPTAVPEAPSTENETPDKADTEEKSSE